MCSKIKISPYLVLLGGLSITTSQPVLATESMDVETTKAAAVNTRVFEFSPLPTRATAQKANARFAEIKLTENKIDKAIEADIAESRALYNTFGTGKKRPQPSTLKNNKPSKRSRSNIIELSADEEKAVLILASLRNSQDTYIPLNVEQPELITDIDSDTSSDSTTDLH